MKLRQITVLFAGVLLSAPVLAGQGMGMKSGGSGSSGMQSGGGHMGSQAMTRRYQMLDINGDGYISRDEVQQREQLMSQIRNNWNQADRNNDGRVDQAEFARFEERVQQQDNEINDMMNED